MLRDDVTLCRALTNQGEEQEKLLGVLKKHSVEYKSRSQNWIQGVYLQNTVLTFVDAGGSL